MHTVRNQCCLSLNPCLAKGTARLIPEPLQEMTQNHSENAATVTEMKASAQLLSGDTRLQAGCTNPHAGAGKPVHHVNVSGCCLGMHLQTS
jgi:hypothetical protein